MPADHHLSALAAAPPASTDRTGVAAGPMAAADALAERIKELNCLYGISNLFETQDVSLPWIMQRAVELIPAAWQYPHNACARIHLDGQQYVTRNFKPSRWCQHADILLDGRRVGSVAVYYLQPPPTEAGEPFLEEERRLLGAISERLSKVLWLKHSEEALKESEARYRVLTEQVAEGVALIQGGRFRYVNPAFCQMFDVPAPQAMVGAPVRQPPAGASQEIGRICGLLVDDASAERIERVERLTLAGQTRWIQVCHSPVTVKGQPALMSTFKDISDIKEQQIAAERIADSLDRENRVLRSSMRDRYRLGAILGRSEAMQTVYELILKAAATDASVAIFGESGTGKELVARAVHAQSRRKAERFLAVNCGAVQESLFEREFFGHRKGAFSGAHADSPGYLDLAAGGTLFLDEVSELTVAMQVKLLRAIEGSGHCPVGSTETRQADFRIISASNTALRDRVEAGAMRDDFFYRIQVIQIRLPPLRHRREDIPLLVEHFLQQMKDRFGTVQVAGRTMGMLIDYDWPGNVRELRNVLQRYATLGRLEFLRPGVPASASAPAAGSDCNLPEALRRLEAALIAQALQQADGHRTRAAALLGISRRALFRKLSSTQVPSSPAPGENARS